jgi:tRNA(Ile)-lysidine synthetase-like protein
MVWVIVETMSTYLSTKMRRASQSLWSKLDHHLLPVSKEGVVLAISGGPDSRALLESIADWPNRAQAGPFLVVSLDHEVRHEAKAEARFIYMRAKRLGFKAHYESLKSDKSGEKDLRKVRYQALCQIANRHSFKAICTAHHEDDDAEGYFMALMGVGGGELGASMKEASKIGNFILVRPFLSLSKTDLGLFLTLKNVTDFVRDRLDERSVGKRALVRNHIFPEIFKTVPQLKKRLAIFGRAQAEQQLEISRISKAALVWHPDEKTVTIKLDLGKSAIISAIWQVLKKWSSERDLRASKHTIERIMEDLQRASRDLGDLPRLDPNLNGFNLKGSSIKEYQFPGLVVLKGPKGLIAKRIDPL